MKQNTRPGEEHAEAGKASLFIVRGTWWARAADGLEEKGRGAQGPPVVVGDYSAREHVGPLNNRRGLSRGRLGLAWRQWMGKPWLWGVRSASLHTAVCTSVVCTVWCILVRHVLVHVLRGQQWERLGEPEPGSS